MKPHLLFPLLVAIACAAAAAEAPAPLTFRLIATKDKPDTRDTAKDPLAAGADLALELGSAPAELTTATIFELLLNGQPVAETPARTEALPLPPKSVLSFKLGAEPASKTIDAIWSKVRPLAPATGTTPVDMELRVKGSPVRSDPLPVPFALASLPFRFRAVNRTADAARSYAPRDLVGDPLSLGSELLVQIVSAPILKTKKPVRLFVNGLQVAATADNAADEPFPLQGRVLRFPLAADSKSAAAIWSPLLKNPWLGHSVPIDLQIGLDEDSRRSESQPALLLTWVTWKFWIWPIVPLFMIVLFWRYRNSDLLRDNGNLPSAAGLPSTNSFSLGRVQMAFWTFIIVSSFAFIWCTTGRLDTLNNSLLALLGVAAGTMIGSVLITDGKRAETAKKLSDATASLVAAMASEAALTLSLAGANAAVPVVQANIDSFEVQLATAKLQVKRLTTDVDQARAALSLQTQGLAADILSDANGISFHRLQLVIWTVVLGLIFTVTTWQNLAMQEFDNTLLGLMGISSGTYLGFKFPEK